MTKHGSLTRSAGTAICAVIASAALMAGCGVEEPVAAPGQPGAVDAEEAALDALPEGPADEYVQTPVGRFHQSCVHEVPNEGEVDLAGAIYLHGQMIQPARRCAFRSFVADRRVARRIEERVSTIEDRVPTVNGWVSSIEAPAVNLGVRPPWFNGLESTMFVPGGAPVVKLFQTLYYFVSMTPADGKAILQPVIQWGTGKAGGGQKWTAAVWLVNRARQAFHSTLVNVTAGESLRGSVLHVPRFCTNAGVCMWDLKITRNGTTITSMRINSAETYTLAQKAVMEAYEVTACNQLPSTGSAVFHLTSLYEPAFTLDSRQDVTTSLAWRSIINSVSPWCNYGTVLPNPRAGVVTWTP
jgi:hypothetical protein